MAQAQHRRHFPHPGVHRGHAGHLHIDGIHADAALGSALRIQSVIGGGYRYQDLVVQAAQKAAALAFQYADNDKLAAVNADGLPHGVQIAEQTALHRRAQDGDLGAVVQLSRGDETALFHRKVADSGIFRRYPHHLGIGVVAPGGHLRPGTQFRGYRRH